MRRIPIFIFCALCFMSTVLHAQLKELGINPQSLVQPSPDVYSLGKYGVMPIGKYTGSPSVSIPLYAIKFEELDIPITLSYNQNGLKVNEEASWAGLGWSLSSHAVITRSIKDGDDLNETNNSVASSKCGWIYLPVYTAWGGDPIALSVPDPILEEIADRNADTGGNTKYRPDMEQDIFTVNLFGTSLQFLLAKKPSGSNLVPGIALNDRLHTITLDLSDKSFTIVDGMGYQYLFETYEESTTYGFYASGIQSITGWFLDEITSPTGKHLYFNYDTTAGAIVRSPEHYSESKDILYCIEGGGSNSFGTGGSSSTTYTVNSYIRLANIFNGSEKVYFVGSDRLDVRSTHATLKAKKLDKIQVLFNGALKKEINFHTSYFNEPRINDADKYLHLRLKLDAVSIHDQWHRFTYLQPNNLPSKHSKAMDIWGYYNGKTSNTSLIPYFVGTAPDLCYTSSVRVTGGYADRDADYRYSQVAQLSKVQYPTGGHTEMVYEGNTVKKNYNEFYEWERIPALTPTVIEHSPASGVESYSFNLPVTSAFSETSRYARIEFNLFKSGPPINIYQQLAGHENEPAIVLTSSSGTVHTVTFGQFKTYCEPLDLATGCPVTNGNSYSCYCFRSISFYTGTLPPGSYSVLLSASVAGLKTSVKISVPTSAYRNKEVGGVRIQSLVDREMNGTMVSKRTFSYADASGFTSGILMAAPLFVQWNRAREENVINEDPCNITQNTAKYVTISSNPGNAIFNMTAGSHIGYSQVTENFIAEASPSDNFYSVSTFQNEENAGAFPAITTTPLTNVVYRCDGILGALTYYYAIVSGLNGLEEITADTRNGSLLTEKHYTNSGEMIWSKVNTYSYLDYTGTSNTIPYINTKLTTRGTNHAPQSYLVINSYQNYYRSIQRFGLVSSTETQYAGGQQFSVAKVKTYTNRWLEKDIEVSESTGTPVITKLYYPQDYSVLTSLTNQNILAKPVKVEQLQNNKLLDATVIDFTAEGLPAREYRYEVSGLNAPPAHDAAHVVPAGYTKKGEMMYYPITLKPKELIGTDGIPVVYYWGYDNKYVVATVKGVRYSDITVSLNDVILQTPASDAALRTELHKLRAVPGAIVTTYTINPVVGITSITDPNNLTTYYTFDSADRLKLIQNPATEILKRFTYHYKQ